MPNGILACCSNPAAVQARRAAANATASPATISVASDGRTSISIPHSDHLSLKISAVEVPPVNVQNHGDMSPIAKFKAAASAASAVARRFVRLAGAQLQSLLRNLRRDVGRGARARVGEPLRNERRRHGRSRRRVSPFTRITHTRVTHVFMNSRRNSFIHPCTDKISQKPLASTRRPSPREPERKCAVVQTKW